MTQTVSKNKTFLNPEQLLKEVGLEPGMTVADFGCGNGFYSVAAGSMVGKKGQVFAVDVLEEALSQTATLARLTRLNNISTQVCDLEKFGTCRVPNTSCDLVIAASLLHQVEKPGEVLREAYRILRSGGKILVVEWTVEAPIGPEPKSRVPESAIRQWLEKSGFRPVADLAAGAFHYALLYSK